MKEKNEKKKTKKIYSKNARSYSVHSNKSQSHFHSYIYFQIGRTQVHAKSLLKILYFFAPPNEQKPLKKKGNKCHSKEEEFFV